MRQFTTAFMFAIAGATAATSSGAGTSTELRLAQAGTSAPTFASLDTNHDGKISLNEASAHDQLFVAFKKLDTNRDGELTQAEFAAYSAAK